MLNCSGCIGAQPDRGPVGSARASCGAYLGLVALRLRAERRGQCHTIRPKSIEAKAYDFLERWGALWLAAREFPAHNATFFVDQAM